LAKEYTIWEGVVSLKFFAISHRLADKSLFLPNAHATNGQTGVNAA
jgi:hypothetical protein